MEIVLAVVCLLAILTVIVAIHEAGHACAARLAGARVREFFIGMPWGPQVAWTSRRSGITYGATFALLGGYTRISGMAPVSDDRAALVLALVNARGRVSVDEVASVLGEDGTDDAYTLLEQLADWGSIRPVWPEGARPGRYDLPDAYETVQRDANGLTVYDRRHDFALPGGTSAGAPFTPAVSADEFFAAERSRTYQGLSFPRRLGVLVAGVACNIALAFVVLVAYFALHGVPGVTSFEVAAVEDGSPAAAAGIRAGDRIVAVDGVDVANFDELGEALGRVDAGSFTLAYEREGERLQARVEDMEPGALLGVSYPYGPIPLALPQAVQATGLYIGEVARSVASLLVPSQTAEVLGESTGIVGIATLTYGAVASGVWEVLLLVGVLSLSLGWMNLLPIPPLDGGKTVIEVIQAVIRRPVSMRVQNGLSLVGMGLFVALFIYMVVQDVASLPLA